jgi:hypothetical protein
MPLVVPVAIALCLLLSAPARAGERKRWSWPVRGPVLSGFRYGADPFARGQRRGIRIGAPVGAEVRAACPGRVRFAGFAGSSGGTVSVACGRLLATYLHLGAIAVRAGERVWQGQRLGTVGRSGRPRLPDSHLAFGARIAGGRWAYVDPLALLERPGRDPPPELVPAGRRPKLPRLGPAPRAPAVPARTPRPLGRPAPRPAGESSGSLPPAAWLGLAALAGALIVLPADRVGRRRRSRAAGGAGAEAASR